jgi:hypothetical protein
MRPQVGPTIIFTLLLIAIILIVKTHRAPNPNPNLTQRAKSSQRLKHLHTTIENTLLEIFISLRYFHGKHILHLNNSTLARHVFGIFLQPTLQK